MAFRTWGRLLLTALGVSMLAGAGQLGIAYGFGIVRLNGAFTDGSVNRWPAQLVWVAWFAAVAAVAGAVLTERLTRRDEFPAGTTEQLSVAGAAALGATVVAPLCMQPARAAELGGTVDPVWAVGICAVLGAVVGAGAALAVLLNPPLGWNIALTGGALWLLALVSVAPALASTGPLPTARLGVLEPSWLDAATAQRLAMLILPAMALLAGAAAGALARRRGHPALVGGAAGAAGPVLVAFAYLTAGPGNAADRYQLAPYYGALIAVAAGALGSTAATVLRRSSETAATDAIEPTDIFQPLPVGPAPTGSPVRRTADGPATADPSPTGAAPAAVAGSTADLGLPSAAWDTRPDAGRPTPAHWDWPVASSGTPTPAPAGVSRPTTGQNARPGDDRRPAAAGPAPTDDRDPTTPSAVPADDRERAPWSAASADDRDLAAPAPFAVDDDPGRLAGAPASGAVARDRTIGPPARTRATGAGPVIERDADDPTQSLPAPTPLSSARRISAVDVVAAGRTPEAARPGTTPARTALPTPAAPTPTPDRPAQATAPTSASGTATTAFSAQAAAPTPATNGSSAGTVTTASSAGTATTASSAGTATTASSAGTATSTAGVGVPGPGVPAPAATRRGGAARPDVEVSVRTPEADAPRPEAEASDGAAVTGPAAVAPLSRSGSPARSRPTASASAASTSSTAPASSTAPPSTGRPKRARKSRSAAGGSAEPTAATPTPVPADAAPVTGHRTAKNAPATTAPAPVAGQSRPAESTAVPTSDLPAVGSRATPTTSSATDLPPATADRSRAAGRSTSADRSTAADQAAADQAAADRAAADRASGADQATAANQAETSGRSGAISPGGGTPESATRTGRPDGRMPTGPAHLAPAAPDDATADAGHALSPRPRVPIFSDDTDRRDDVRPAWPMGPAPGWPTTPRQATAPTGPTTDATNGGAPVEPAPRPRHRALPDLGRAASWEALANARRGAGPNAVDPAPANSAGPGSEGAHQADDAGRETDERSPAAAGAGEEADAGKSRPRRGLFRRNRAKGGEDGTADRNSREAEPVPAHDEEYVDWVAGLGRPAADSDSGSLRTGRHHRD